MLHSLLLLAVSLFLAVACASPRHQADYDDPLAIRDIVTVTSTLTATVIASTLTSTTTSSTTTYATPLTQPTSWLTVTAARSGSEIHLLPMNAAGLRFWLGGNTISYCPEPAEAQGACPPGNTTVLSLCSMGVLVPGGQQIYVTPRGELGYTQAHSVSMPPGAVSCPFTYTKAPGAYIGRLLMSIGAPFGITGFMACPTRSRGIYQVFGNLKNATVPLGNVSQCIGFDPLAADAPGLGAWQYS
ncbi:hypothetical protein CLCR_03078 [Cladophialophora carrionii]|uniref:IgE-binding protein n=1 Tax=Cladophialophora carrionii TaxID=86049 RepID=A0A1C1D1L1_9EURO|nr:hypothetical protein CLCR_03078 [Cladophialophora carrionii]